MKLPTKPPGPSDAAGGAPRGETQPIVVTTLGTGQDEQLIDSIIGEYKEAFMLHYNFPRYSVGECGRMGAPGRREIGHGKLAWRAIHPMIPAAEDFPYTLRVVSEITESNGSSSMATVCGTSLSLMDAGVPLSKPIAGIAMRLIKDGSDFAVLSDILGDEDHLGDMDFKVAGTQDGNTALQMDIKITSITEEIMKIALAQGRFSAMQAMLSATYQLRLGATKAPSISVGASVGMGGRTIQYQYLYFDNQYTGDRYNPNLQSGEQFPNSSFYYPDVAAGLSYQYTKSSRKQFTMGIGIHHLNQARQSFLNDKNIRLDLRYTINTKLRWQICKKLDLVPEAQFRYQDTKYELAFGVHTKAYIFKQNKASVCLNTGAYYRNNDAFYLLLGMDYNAWQVNLS